MLPTNASASRWTARALTSITVLLLLAPLCFTVVGLRGVSRVDRPRVYSGDETHYLIQINSIVSDGDLDLKNNYDSVHQGSLQAGENAATTTLDHHALWFVDGVRYNWGHIYEVAPERWERDANGHPRATKMPSVPAALEERIAMLPEYGGHPYGLAFVLAPVLLPFRGTAYLESAAVVCSALAVVAAFGFFVMLLRVYVADNLTAWAVAGATFLGTPIWHYGRTLFTEPYLLLCATAAYALMLRKNMTLLSGGFIAIGLLMKPPFLLLILPLAIDLVLRRKLAGAFKLCLLPGIASALVLYLNYHMLGSPFRAQQSVIATGDVFAGVFGLLLSSTYGLVPLAPVALVAILCWFNFARDDRREAIIFASAFIPYTLFMAQMHNWSGSSCYGPRYIVPLLPFLFIALVKLPETDLCRQMWGRSIIGAVVLLSVAINFLGAIQYWKYWNAHPLGSLLASLTAS